LASSISKISLTLPLWRSGKL